MIDELHLIRGGVFLLPYAGLSYKKRAVWPSFAIPLEIAFTVIAVPFFRHFAGGEHSEQCGVRRLCAEADLLRVR